MEKHFRFNKDFVTNSNKVFYRLLYGDKHVVCSLHGSVEPFTLKRHKEEIDKPYSRITLYLCSSSDYSDSIFLELSSDSDPELSDVSSGFTPKVSTGAEGRIQNSGSGLLPSSVPSCSSDTALDFPTTVQQGGLMGDTFPLKVKTK